MMRVADYIMERLYGEGARHIFMVTGRGVLFLSDALARHGKLQGIATHHEQAAAFAAVAYAQYTEKIGACLVSTGCAATNALTGVLNAWQDGVPCVFVSGQNQLKETVRHTGIALRTFGNQEADIIPIVTPITKYAVMLADPKDTVYEVGKALHQAQNGRKGPVWIDVPLDVQNMRIEPEKLRRFEPGDEALPSPTTDDIAYVASALRDAKRPVLLVGNGVRSADAVGAFMDFLAKRPFPVTFACSAVDVYGSGNPLAIGAVGSIGATRSGNFAVQNSDLLLVLGCRLSPITTGPEYTKFARSAKVIVVDIDKVEHSKNTVRIDRLIHADLKVFLSALLKEDIRPAEERWIAQCLHWKKVFPKCEEANKRAEKVDLYHLAECLSESMPKDTVLLTDSGLEELIIPSAVDFKSGQRCIHPASQGSMGAALPAAVGSYFASLGARGPSIVAVIGDGSIMMNLQELQTVKHHAIPIKLFVVNNNVYAVIRKRQVDLFRTRTIGTDPSNGVSCPAFRDVAACFGLAYHRIERGADLKREVEAVLNRGGSILCEVMGLEDQEYIMSSSAFNSERRMVRRPLEDQAPYLDRERFLSEMIVAPIDQ